MKFFWKMKWFGVVLLGSFISMVLSAISNCSLLGVAFFVVVLLVVSSSWSVFLFDLGIGVVFKFFV